MHQPFLILALRRLSLLFMATIGLVSIGHTQIQVSQEKRHHKVFENAYLRVLDVHLPPHDTTLMHKHSTPSVFLILSKTKTGSETLVEPAKPSFADGNIWFEGFYDKPRIHRVWNEDTVEFHVMDIELPHSPGPATGIPDNPPFSKQLFDEKPVRAFRMTLPAGEHQRLAPAQTPILVIGLSGPSANGEVNNHPFTKKGDYLFIPAGTALTIANNNTTEHQFAILYLK